MLSYDYKCTQCEMVSEILIRNLRKDAPRCPACGSANMEKLVSASCSVRTQIGPPGHCVLCQDETLRSTTVLYSRYLR